MKYEVETYRNHREVYTCEASTPEEAIKIVSEGGGEPVVGGETNRHVSAREYRENNQEAVSLG